jgi:uncharacterized protein YuzE
MDFQVQRDDANDLLYILLRRDLAAKRGSVHTTIRVTEDIFLDFDQNQRLIGIDILNASRVVDSP